MLLLFWMGLIAACSSAYAAGSPQVTTDKSDYAPGETALISGSGFAAHEGIVLQVSHLYDMDFPGDGHDPWIVEADANGNFEAEWYVAPDFSLDQTLLLTADGRTSRHAETTFTDAGSTACGTATCGTKVSALINTRVFPYDGTSKQMVYGGDNTFPVTTTPYPVPLIVLYRINGTTTTDTTPPTNVGTYDVICKIPDDQYPNYYFVNSLQQQTQTITRAKALIINPVQLTVTADDKSRAYGAANPPFTASYSGFVNGENLATSGVTGNPSFSTTPTDTTASPVGSYPITPAKGDLASTNYTFKYSPGTLTVSKAPLTVTADSQSKTYGTPNPTLTYKYAGFANGETLATSGVTGVPTLSTTADASSAVGPYPISITQGTLAASNYSFTLVNGTLTINQAALFITADDKSKTYGTANPALTASYTGFVNGDTPASLTGTLVLTTGATGSSPVSTYDITPSGVTSTNYTINFVNGTLAITKAALTVTADNQSKTYGAANPALTASYSGLVNGDTAAVVTGNPALSTTATANSVVGTYPITAAAGTLAATNYSFTFVDGTLTVTKAPLTIQANNVSKTYGTANPTFTGTITGLQNGDAITATYSTTITNTTPVGTYLNAIVPAAVDSTPSTLGNYNVSLINGTLTITKSPFKGKTFGTAEIVVTASDAVYDGQPHGATDTLTVDGVPSNTPPAITYSGRNGTTYGPSTTPPTNVGDYTATATYAGDANHFSSSDSKDYSITPRPLTLKADDITRSYGSSTPAFSNQITNGSLVVGDTLSGTATYTTDVTPAVNVGTYTITLSGLSNPNYAITFTTGVLTINPVKPVVTVIAPDTTYTGTAYNQATATVTGVNNTVLTGVTVTYTYYAANLDGSQGGVLPGAPTNAGTYYVIGSVAANGNYDAAASQPVKFVIKKACLKVTANDVNRAYGTANPTFTANITGFVNGETLATSGVTGSPALTTSATTASPVGSYTITAAQGSLSATNYSFTFTAGTLTITKATLTVTANDATRASGTANPTFTASYSGFVNGETLATSGVTGSPALTTTATTTSPTGTYPITAAAGTLAANNYSFTFVNGTLTVTPACIAPAITVQPTSTATCVGGMAKFTVTATGTGLSYQWYKGTTAIASATTNSLLLNPVQASDASSYYVKVSGSCGSVNSATVTLTVSNTPVVTVGTENVCTGTSASLTATDTANASGDTYLWKATVGTTQTIVGTTQTITVTPTVSTTYTVTVTSAGGCSTTASGSVYVNTCTPGATRTQGYWSTHLSALQRAVTQHCIDLRVLKVVPSGTQDLTYPTLGQVEAIMWSQIGSQTLLGQARLQLGQQLVAAMCNVNLLGTTPAMKGYSATLITDARTALDGTDINKIKSFITLVDGFNNSGDKLPISSNLGSAQPKDAQSAATTVNGVIDAGPAFK